MNSDLYGVHQSALKFDIEETNIGGDFAMTGVNDGKFTCRIAGTYVFAFTIAIITAGQEPVLDLVKTGAFQADHEYYPIVRVWVREGDPEGHLLMQSSQTAVVQLAVGDRVWLRFANHNQQVFSDADNKLSSFSGFLLSAAPTP